MQDLVFLFEDINLKCLIIGLQEKDIESDISFQGRNTQKRPDGIQRHSSDHLMAHMPMRQAFSQRILQWFHAYITR